MVIKRRAARKSVAPISSSGKTIPKKVMNTLSDKSNSSSTVLKKRPRSRMSIKKPVLIHGKGKLPVARKNKSTVLQEIQYLQRRVEPVLQHAKVVRTIKFILATENHDQMRLTKLALNSVHEVLEAVLVKKIEMSYMISKHTKRVTLYASDIQLVERIISEM